MVGSVGGGEREVFWWTSFRHGRGVWCAGVCCPLYGDKTTMLYRMLLWWYVQSFFDCCTVLLGLHKVYVNKGADLFFATATATAVPPKLFATDRRLVVATRCTGTAVMSVVVMSPGAAPLVFFRGDIGVARSLGRERVLVSSKQGPKNQRQKLA